MAEEEVEFEGEEPEFESSGGGGGRKRLIVLIAVPLVVLVIAGGAFFLFRDKLHNLFAPKAPPPVAEASDANGEAVALTAAPNNAATSDAIAADSRPITTLELPDILVNINTGARTKNFLKLKIILELANEADVAVVENAEPRIIDNFQIYLRGLKPDDLNGAAGVYRLREEMLNRINAAVRPAQVKDVLFRDFIVQ